MAIITNIKHFLDEDGEVANLTLEAQELFSFLIDVVESATIDYARPVALAETKCRSVVDGKICQGEIEVWVYAEDNHIGWECLECGEEGVVTQWEGTPWDRRDYVRH
jgi:hypothetical protein